MKNSIQMNNTNEIAPTSLSYAGGGYNLILVQLVENNNFPKAIVPILLLANYPLSIVNLQLGEANYPLSIIHY